ncbi:hypothetical protein IWX90DRAFT_9996 [Phyllosticta citrichinensis]|uniref:Uncharacterized protein n=1 Tax=Phyllosticta citrichinensis TaxID=1130410 RepID=A0ABR1Y643_9PEZI
MTTTQERQVAHDGMNCYARGKGVDLPLLPTLFPLQDDPAQLAAWKRIRDERSRIVMLLREQEREAGQSSPKPTPPTTTAPVPQAPAIKRPSGSSSQSAQAQAQTPKRPPPGESAFPYLTPSIGKPPIEEFETAPPPTAQAYKPQAKPSASLEQGKPNDVPVEAQGQVKPNATVEAQGEGKAKCVPLDYHSAEQGRGNARYQGNQQGCGAGLSRKDAAASDVATSSADMNKCSIANTGLESI